MNKLNKPYIPEIKFYGLIFLNGFIKGGCLKFKIIPARGKETNQNFTNKSSSKKSSDLFIFIDILSELRVDKVEPFPWRGAF